MIDEQLARAWQKLTKSKIQERPCETDVETGELYICSKPLLIDPFRDNDGVFKKTYRALYKKHLKQWNEQMQNGPKAWAYFVNETDWGTENWSAIPDLEEDPWDWILAFTNCGWNITIGSGVPLGVAIVKSHNLVTYTTGDIPEKAFEAAIRGWERMS